MRMRWLILPLSATFFLSLPAVKAETFLDFSQATVVVPADASKLENKAARVLAEEVKKRTGLDLAVENQWNDGIGAMIVVGSRGSLPSLHPSMQYVGDLLSPGAEGFTLSVQNPGRPLALILGEDPRGALYGVGYLLRKTTWAQGSLRIPSDLRISTAPRFPLRGHQLGNRDVNNTYDAWTPEQYDQYIRDLALFGANAIELIPPNIADFPTDRSNRKVPAEEMMLRLVDMVDSYGMDVWFFYPNSLQGAAEWDDPGDELFLDLEFVRGELQRRADFFRRIKRLDGLFVPGGDPGGLSPDVLFQWLPKVAEVLRRYHPEAKIWVSDQLEKSDPAAYESFIRHINEKPGWLGGVVCGPWGRTSIPEMRARVDASIPIRRYPDITHVTWCQYPILDYDRAFAVTLGREPIAPRPLAFKHIHNLFDEYAVGSLAYSEGAHDDVNKFVWLDQDWNPETPVMETLRDYVRWFLDPARTEGLAQGLIALEKNLDGVLAGNQQVEVTLGQWQELEAGAGPELRSNFRFQLGLFRACYDAYLKRRLAYETHLEDLAVEALGGAPEKGSLAALDQAREILNRIQLHPVGRELRARCFELGDLLRENIGIQMSVERHGAVRKERAAVLDAIDDPLTDSAYLEAEMEKIRRMGEEAERLRGIGDLLSRTNPGAGNFYDDFGSPSSMERVVMPADAWVGDPGTLRWPRRSFTYGGPQAFRGEPAPLSWFGQVSSLFDKPLEIRYRDLDREARYEILVVHPLPSRLSLEADGHPVYRGVDVSENPVLEYPVPVEATKDGEVVFSWTCGPEDLKATVAEVWLKRLE